jgi:ABC-2 type transport system permease protein
VSGETALSTRFVIRHVAGREVKERVRARSFYVSTGLLVVLILAIGVIASFAGDDGPAVIEVGLAEPAPTALPPAIADAAASIGRETAVTSFDDSVRARDALDDGDVDVVVDVAENELLFAEGIDDEVAAIVQQAWSSTETQRALLDAGLDQDQVTEALTVSPLQPVALDPDGDGPGGLAVLIGTLAAVLLFIALQTFGTYVLTGVVEEKSTAVIELLLVRAAPDQLLAGKVIGIGIAAMAQFALAVIASLISLRISGVEVPSEVWSAVPMTLVWFLGGYALYSTLFALAGSLVSRQEDAQAAATPIFTALLGGYLLVFIFGSDPDSTASTVMSLIPPIAPLLMPMRMAAGAASIIEIVVALVLLAAATFAMWKLASKIFEQVLLRRGSRISWRDAAKLGRDAR